MKNANALILLLGCGVLFTVGVTGAVWLYLERSESALPAVLRESPDDAASRDPDVTQQQLDVVRRALSADNFMDVAIRRFHLRMKRYPKSIDELVRAPVEPADGEKWNGPYVRNAELLSDPWGRPFQYLSPGQHNLKSYDIWSLGADGISGTNDDIGNW